jgi:hypothetical protein
MKVKLIQARYKLLGVVLVLTVLASISFWLFKYCRKEIAIIGFAVKNDRIVIAETKANFIAKDNENDKGLCSFYKKESVFTFSSYAELHIQIDSSGAKLLDTVLRVAFKNNKCLISFQDPFETNYRRGVFTVDETDKRLVIPD